MVSFLAPRGRGGVSFFCGTPTAGTRSDHEVPLEVSLLAHGNTYDGEWCCGPYSCQPFPAVIDNPNARCMLGTFSFLWSDGRRFATWLDWGSAGGPSNQWHITLIGVTPY